MYDTIAVLPPAALGSLPMSSGWPSVLPSPRHSPSHFARCIQSFLAPVFPFSSGAPNERPLRAGSATALLLKPE